MKKIVLFVGSCILLINCSTPEKNINQNLRFKNDSNQKIYIQSFYQNELKFTEEINSNEFGINYLVQTSGFSNFGAICDSISIKFTLNKGYLCSFSNSSLCFPSKPSPLDATEENFVKEGDIYYYIITQDDYLNAFDL
jgi:hypothetical protein